MTYTTELIFDKFEVNSILVALLVFYVVYNYLIWPRISPLRALPGPNYCLPLFGSTDVFKILVKKEGYQAAQRAHEKYGPLSRRFIFGAKEAVLVTGASELATILKSKAKLFDRSEEQCEFLSFILGKGLVTTRGEEHGIMRKILNPSFTINTVKGFMPKFYLHSNRLLDYWSKYILQKTNKENYVEVCILGDIPKMSLDVFMDCAFGYKNCSSLSTESPINRALNFLLRSSNFGIERIIHLINYLPLKKFRIHRESRMLVEETINNVIAQKRQQNTHSEETNALDLLDRMLLIRDENGLELSDKELFDHILTFMFAGYETTSTSLTWALLNLAQNPKIQNRLREEILSICPDNNSDITWEQLEKMSYLNSIIMESLRYNPSVPSFQKVSLEDVVLGDYIIPANTLCLLWPGVAQNSKNYWNEPEKFNPQLFLDSEENIKVPGSYLPFGGGKTMCIGNKFALIEMKVVLTTLIRDLIFSIAPGSKFETRFSVTTYPSPLPKLRIQKYVKNNNLI